MKAARRLLASFANLRPADPAAFAEVLADALQGYPPRIAAECAARLPLETEFLSIKAVADWCERETAWHQKVATATIIPRKPERAELPDNPERAAAVQQLITGAARKIP